jgi:hypothetical protein
MTVLVRRLAFVLPVALLAIGACVAGIVAAEGSTTGPVVSLSKTTVSPGERIMVTINGFSAHTVTISVCGNDARRGSGDCNMVKSKGVRIDPAVSPTVTKFGVSEPPYGCPCLVRVSSINGEEIAVAPITLTGHPVERVVSAPKVDGPFVAVAIKARPAPRGSFGWTRANLGGPFRYEVTVTVRNLTTEPLHLARVSGFVSRSVNANVTTLPLTDPGEIGVGQTWKQTVSVTLPAPSFGKLSWHVAVSGAGPTVTADATTHHRPILLMVILMLLIIDVSLLLMRFTIRRRIAREATLAEASDIEGAIDTTASDDDDVGFRLPELVSAGDRGLR